MRLIVLNAFAAGANHITLSGRLESATYGKGYRTAILNGNTSEENTAGYNLTQTNSNRTSADFSNHVIELSPSVFSVYLVPAMLIVGWYLLKYRSREQSSRHALKQAIEDGMTEPASLHPIIDQARCIGCRSCTEACPEQSTHPVLGMIGYRAKLVTPGNCIGHGACKQACPADAIELVFGTEKRGIDIPQVNPDFQTNIDGIYIAGELGGMGLIRNTIEQGRKAMESIVKSGNIAPAVRDISGSQASCKDMLDVIVVGAGPAGFAASLSATQHKLKFLTLEQDTLGGTVAHFPRGKLVMTQPAELPLYGKTRFRETSKEALLEFWQDVEQKTGLQINYEERVVSISRNMQKNGFELTTDKNTYITRNVLLCIGRRGTPRQLGVPGEELSKVVYRLIDPEQYRDMQVLVVGGGDSALEAACSIATESNATVTLSYRSGAFSRAKPANRQRVESLAADNRLTVHLNSTVATIHPESVVLNLEKSVEEIANDAVIVSAGGILPTTFLRETGIDVQTHHGKVA